MRLLEFELMTFRRALFPDEPSHQPTCCVLTWTRTAKTSVLIVVTIVLMVVTIVVSIVVSSGMLGVLYKRITMDLYNTFHFMKGFFVVFNPHLDICPVYDYIRFYH